MLLELLAFSGESYDEALNITGLQTLFERRERLCVELFQSISNNNHHKLFNLLPELSQTILISDVNTSINDIWRRFTEIWREQDS